MTSRELDELCNYFLPDDEKQCAIIKTIAKISNQICYEYEYNFLSGEIVITPMYYATYKQVKEHLNINQRPITFREFDDDDNLIEKIALEAIYVIDGDKVKETCMYYPVGDESWFINHYLILPSNDSEEEAKEKLVKAAKRMSKYWEKLADKIKKAAVDR